MIVALRDEGVTIFLTTHYLEEAERLCDRVAIIVKGPHRGAGHRGRAEGRGA